MSTGYALSFKIDHQTDRSENNKKRRAIILSLLMVMLVQTTYFSSYSPPVLTESTPAAETHTGTSDRHLNESVFEVGLSHTCVVGTSTTLELGDRMKCWGAGDMGQLGIGNTQDMGDQADEMGDELPFVDTGVELNITKTALGESHTCALFENGSVKCWGQTTLIGIGYNDLDGFGDGYLETGETLPYLPVPTGRHVIDIEAGKRHTCAILDNQDVACWGDNAGGQLGLGNTSFIGDSPDETGDSLPMVDATHSTSTSAPASMALGWDHTCLLFSNGTVSCWGDNSHGQLGTGSTASVGDQPGGMGDSLVQVSLPTGRTAVQITAGDDFTCALLDNAEVACWGDNSNGQLGIGTTSDQGDSPNEMGDSMSMADLGANAIAIDAGRDHVCALLQPANVKCWGGNQAGQLGYGDTQNRGDGLNEMGSNLQTVNLGRSVLAVSAGDQMTCTMDDIKRVQCFGINVRGQLGIESTNYIGDDSADMPPSEAHIDIGESFEGSGCQSYLFPPYHSTFSGTTVDDSSNDLGGANDMALLSDGCPAVSYADSENDDVKVAILINGLWTVETPIRDTASVLSTSIAVDGSDRVHLIAADPSYDASTQDVVYSTKIAGRWVNTQLPQSLNASNVDLLSTPDGLVATWTTGSKVTSMECPSNCHLPSQWSEALDESYSGVTNIETTYDHASGATYIAFTSGNNLRYLTETATGTQTALLSTDASSSATERGISIDSDFEGNLYVAFANSTGAVMLIDCNPSTATCSSASAWSIEDTGLTGGDIHLSLDRSLQPHIVANDAGSLVVSSKEDGAWGAQSAFNYESEWSSIAVDDYGRAWLATQIGVSDDLWVFDAWGLGGNGLDLDPDQDGFTGYDEFLCGTDPFDASSVPTDFDLDGRCDEVDDSVDLPAVGESQVVTMGDSFGCAITDARGVACWGLNDQGQLGRPTTGSNDQRAGMVTGLPIGFQAVSLDAGHDHACAVGAGGDVYCWGRNQEGQLGDNSSSDMVKVPLPVRALTVSAGATHTCVTTSDGGVTCWGTGTDGQLGPSGSSSLPAPLTQGQGALGNYPMELVTVQSRGGAAASTNQGAHGTHSGFVIPITTLASSGQAPFTITFDYRTSSESCCDRIMVYTLNSGSSSFYTSHFNQWSNTWTSSGSINFNYHRDVYITFYKDGSVNGGEDTGWVDDIVVRDSSNNIVYQENFDNIGSGQIKPPSSVDLPSPIIEEVSAGTRHTCAIDSQRQALCWGFNGGISTMTLGDSSTQGANSTDAVYVDLAHTGSEVGAMPGLRSISAGGDATCGILDTGLATVCWGKGVNGVELLGSSSSAIGGSYVDAGATGERHISVSVGEEHACSVVETSVYCWGREDSGELGDGGAQSSTPGNPVQADIGYGTPIEVVVGTDASCAVIRPNSASTSSRIGCWGEASSGQMGSGALPDQTTGPGSADRLVEYSEGSPVVSAQSTGDLRLSPSSPYMVSLGSDFACYLSQLGLVKCAGGNYYGQLGRGDTTTHRFGSADWVDLGSNRTATMIDSGDAFTCALLDNGDVKCWGRGYLGRLGAGNWNNIGDQPNEMGDNLQPVQLGQPATSISVGLDNACAVLADGTIWCWGYNDYGKLGLGTTASQSTPQEVDLGPGMVAHKVVTGRYNTCALMASGQVKCWGMGNHGILGRGDTTHAGDQPGETGSSLPFVDLGTSRYATDITLGEFFACASMSDMTTLCWGFQNAGQLGINSYSNMYVGRAGDADGDGFSDDMSDDLAEVIMRNKSLLPYTVLDLASALDPIVDVDSSYQAYHACGITSARDVYCWGSGSYGVLGDAGSSHNYWADVVANSPHSAQSIETGVQRTCMVTTSAKVHCWGNGGYYDFNDASGYRYTPILVDIDLHSGDSDLDGWLDLWDTDDDNDGHLDDLDAFPTDACAHLDHDLDGSPDAVLPGCTTLLTEDLDDDNDGWSDLDEVICGWDPLDDTLTPGDPDGDGTCNALDLDDDNDGWSDQEEWACETRNNARKFTPHAGYGPRYAWRDGVTIGFHRDTLRVIGEDSSNTKLWSFEEAATESGGAGAVKIPIVSPLGHPSGLSDSQAASDYNRVNFPELLVHDNQAYVANTLGLFRVYETSSSLTQYYFQSLVDRTSNSQNAAYFSSAAIAPNGTAYITDSDGIEVYHLDSDTLGTRIAPLPLAGKSNGYRIDVDPSGTLWAAYYTSTGDSSTTGVYVTDWDGASWGAPTLAAQTTLAQDGYGHFEYEIDHSGAHHLATYYQGVSHFTNASGAWSLTHHEQGTVSTTYGRVALAVSPSGDAHMAWYDKVGNDLIHTRAVSGTWFSNAVHDFDNDDGQYRGIDIALDPQGDPRIYAQVDQVQGDPVMVYYGSFEDPSQDNSSVPSDSNSDGLCDALQSAVLDYGQSELTFEMGFESTYAPLYEGLLPTSISIAPALPTGLQIDPATGVIHGTPLLPSTQGSTHTITTTSENEVWFGQVEVRVLDAPPMIADLQNIPNYNRGAALHDTAEIEYDPQGNTYQSGHRIESGCGSATQITKRAQDGSLLWCTEVRSGSGIQGNYENAYVQGMKVAPDGSLVVSVVKFGDLLVSTGYPGTQVEERYESNMHGFAIIKIDPLSGAPIWVRTHELTQDGTEASTTFDNRWARSWVKDSLSLDDSGGITFSYVMWDDDGPDKVTEFAGLSLPTAPPCTAQNGATESHIAVGVMRLGPDGAGGWHVPLEPLNGTSCTEFHTERFGKRGYYTEDQHARAVVTAHPDGSVSVSAPFQSNISIGGVVVEPRASQTVGLAIARISSNGQVMWADSVSSTVEGSDAIATNWGNGHVFMSDFSTLVSYDNGDLGAVLSARDCYAPAPAIDFLGEEVASPGTCWLAALRVDATGSVVWSTVLEGFGLMGRGGTLHSVLDADQTMRLLIEREDYEVSDEHPHMEFGSLRMVHIDSLGRVSATSASSGGSGSADIFAEDIAVDPNGDTVWIGTTYNQKWGRQTASTTLSDGQQTSYGGLFRMFNHISHEASDTFSVPGETLRARSGGSFTDFSYAGDLPADHTFYSDGRVVASSSATPGDMGNVTITQRVSVGGQYLTRSIDARIIVADHAPEAMWDTVGRFGWTTGSGPNGEPHYPFETSDTFNVANPDLCSSNVGVPDSVSSIERTVSISSGLADLRVTWGTDSHSGDALELWIDGVYIASKHGSMTVDTYTMTEGEHTVQIRFAKNSNTDAGADRGCVAGVSLYERDTGTYPLNTVFDPAPLELTRGVPMEELAPIRITGQESLHSFYAEPSLPPALTIDPDTGAISGTPAVNTHAPWDDLLALAESYVLRVCNDWHTRHTGYRPVCSDAPLEIRITEPAPDFTYGDSNDVVLPRDIYAEVLPENSGGDSGVWTIDGELPFDLSFDPLTGAIHGHPYLITEPTTISITATNTGGTTTVEVTLSVVGDGIAVSLPTPAIQLVQGQEMQPFAGQATGAPVQLWVISPNLPDGLSFGELNGTIWGAPESTMPMTPYTIQVVSGSNTDSTTLMISVIMDTEGDSDLDGWKDEVEVICNTDPVLFESRPTDLDGDGICDFLDSDTDGDGETDEREERCDSDPLNATSLPPDTNENGFCDAEEEDRDNDGILDFLDAFPDDASANRDTDGDGMPDELTGASTSDPPLIEDTDDDGDGWEDLDEILCGSNPKRSSDVPPDMDSDMICDTQDDDTDGDGWSNEVESGICGGNPLDASVMPADLDSDMICDAVDGDIDGDGWSNEDENKTACGQTDIYDASDLPSDQDGDGICDGEDVSPTAVSLSSITDFWWLCCLLLLLILLLALIPLLRGRDKTGLSHLAGPEPPNTTSTPGFQGGSGTKSDPFVLEPSEGIPAGGRATCREVITITGIDPNNIVPVSDRAEGTNGYRFNLTSDEHQESDNDLLMPDSKGRVTFAFEFEDRVPTRAGATYESRYRVGSGSVHFLWRVTVDPDPGYAASEEDMVARQTEQRRIAEEAAARKEAEHEILKARAEAERAKLEAEQARIEAERVKAEAAAAAEAQRKQAEAEAAAAAEAQRKQAEA
ncbi:MAG: hypothetical protein VW544_03315, partial [Euryarchaeota archaeon]